MSANERKPEPVAASSAPAPELEEIANERLLLIVKLQHRVADLEIEVNRLRAALSGAQPDGKS